MARKRTVEPDPEDLRKDLLAAMAAARELGPEMDTAVVDAHLRRHYGEGVLEAPRAVQPATPPPPAPAPRASAPMGLYLGAGLAVLPIVAVVFVAAVVGWHAFPFLFFLWPLFAWCAFGRRRMWRHYGGYGYGRRWDGGREYGRDDWRDHRDDGITEVGYRSGGDRGRIVSASEIV